MVAMNAITEFCQRIVDRFGVQRIILFGSYAKGVATSDSDVDLLIVMPFEGRSVDESVKIRLVLKPAFPVDLIVRTSDYIHRRIQQGDTFLRDIMENGKVIYAADHD